MASSGAESGKYLLKLAEIDHSVVVDHVVQQLLCCNLQATMAKSCALSCDRH